MVASRVARIASLRGVSQWIAGAVWAGALIMVMTAGLGFAQDDADIPPKFKGLITEDQYQKLRDDYVNLLRGLPADPRLRDQAVKLMQSQQKSGPRGAAVAWSPLGPSPIPNGQVTGEVAVSGRVTAFAIDPNNSNKVYLGTAQGGIYRSLDAGTTWVQIFDGANSSAIGALALAPSDSTKLFVGTGESNLSGDSYAGVGLYRIDNADTTATLVGPINPVRNYNDGGGNPQSVPVFNGRSVTSILVHPTDPSIVFVGTDSGVMGIEGEPPLGGTIPPLGMRGLYRLTNATGPAAGVVAQKLTVTLAAPGFDTPNTGNRNVMSMVFEPGNPNNMVVWVLGNATAGDGGIYRSTNAQAATPTFTQVLTTTTSSARAQLAIYKQASAPNVVVYAATGESNGRVRVSTDGGATWPTITAGGGGFCGGQCFYNIGLDVLPGPTAAVSDDIILIGGNVGGSATPGTRLFGKSTDGGATFPDSSSGLHADTHFIRIDPNNSNVIYHGNDGGIFKSVNGGATWTTLNTMPLNTVQFSGLAVHPIDANWSIGGTQDNGTNMRMSNGSWFRVDFGDGGYALVDRNATDTTNMTLYHTYFNQTNGLIGFARVLSTACASEGNWTFLGANIAPSSSCDGASGSNGLVLSDAVLFYAPMELGPGNPNTLYFGAGSVYRSTNRGNTMSAVSQSSLNPVSSIAVSPQDDNYRMFGRTDGTVFYTATGANPMTALGTFGTSPLNKFVSRVKFDPNNKNTAYVCLGGYYGGTSSTQSHVFKVTNLGASPVITAINSGLPDVPVNAFAVDPDNSNNLFAGTDIGVYNSINGGTNWVPYGTGLPVVAVFGMEVQAGSSKLRIATHGRGMWEIPTGSGSLPDLTIAKSHTGNFLQGQTGATYTITVKNSGTATTTGTVTVVDTLPTGLTATAMSGTGWGCTLATRTCTRNDGLTGGSSYPAITLTVNVAANASSGTNSVTVSGGGEFNTSNDTANDPTTIIPVVPDLTIAKSHVGNFTQGTNATYTITVTNSGNAPTSGTVTVVDTLPPGLTATTMSGTGWACVVGTLTCTRSDALAASSSYPPISLTVSVAANASSGTNSVTVSGGGETNTSNDTATDPTTIMPLGAHLLFVPMTPCRVLDTRGPTGPFGGPSLVGGGFTTSGGPTRTFPIPTSTNCTIPANAVAYSFNVTVIPQGPLGFLTMWPTGQPRPLAVTIDDQQAQILNNAAIVPAGTAGSVDVFASNNTDIAVDINGYFIPSGPGALVFVPMTPCRVVDTRNPTGPLGGPSLVGGGFTTSGGPTRTFPIPTSTNCTIPANAAAYSFNVTVIPQGPLGFLTMWPTGQTRPLAVTIDDQQAQILNNAAIVPAGTSGSIDVFASNNTDIAVDINGYFISSAVSSLVFVAITPCRVVDTRGPTGPFGGPSLVGGGFTTSGGPTRTFPILSTNSCPIPSNAAAYSFNVTAIPPGSLGFLTMWPTGQTRPLAVTLDDLSGVIVNIAALVPGGTSGSVDVFASQNTDLVIDINGYFVPSP